MIEEVIEEVIVIGIRQRGLQEVKDKREKNVIFDGLSADAISGVPDFNIADALRRIVGVSAEFDEDEGRFINVRGIDSHLNRVTFDGMTIPSTGSFGGSGRNVNIEFLPSTAVKDLEVYKTFNSSIDGSSIGGYVNVKTRSAFDTDGFYLVSKLTVSDYFTDVPFDNDLPIRGELTTSKIFGADEQFGFVLTGLYSRRPRDQEKFFSVASRSGISNAEGAALPPNRFNVSLYNNDQERFGGNGRIEFRTDDLYTYLSGYLYRQEESEVRYVNNVTGYGGNDVTITSPTTGDVTDVRFDVTSSDFPIEKEGRGVHFHLDKMVGDVGRLDIDIGYAKQTFDHETTDSNFRFDPNTPETDFSYDTSTTVPTRTAVSDQSAILQSSRYFNNFLRFRDLHTDEDVLEFKLDFEHNMASNVRGFGWRAGLSYRDLKRIRDNDEWRFVGKRNNSLADFGSLLSGRTYNSYFQPEPFIFLDPGAIRRFYAAQGLSETGAPGLAFHEANSLSSDFTYQEDVSVVYFQAAYASEKYRISGGFRYEGTNFSSTAQQDSTSLTKGNFSHLLPAINFFYLLANPVKIRLGYSKTLGRPNPGDLVSTLRVNDLTNNAGSDTGRSDDVELIVTRGNPDLKPRTSDNYDISLEYYFLKGEGLIAVAWFRKDIKGDIFRSEEIGIFEERPTEFRQNLNLTRSAVEGVELTVYMGKLAFLPGPLGNLGISANFTWLDGKMDVPVDDEVIKFDDRFRQPDYIANTSIFYSTKKLEARISYNKTGGAIRELRRAEESYEQLDASVKYRATNHWHVKLTGRNLAGRPRRQYDDGENFSYDFLFGQTDIKPSYHLGVTYKY